MEVSGLVGGETFSYQEGNHRWRAFERRQNCTKREFMVGKKDHKGITHRQVSFGVVRSKE